MYYRLLKANYEEHKGAGNRLKMKRVIQGGQEPGILAFDGSDAIGWCSVAPRKKFVRLEKARTLKRVDDKPVWSITCLFILPQYRRQGLSAQLLSEAVKHAASKGATIVEGYPFDPGKKDLPGPWVWTGLASAYKKAGFVEVLRRSATRPIVRYYISEE